jgi:hypothetical protein
MIGTADNKPPKKPTKKPDEKLDEIERVLDAWERFESRKIWGTSVLSTRSAKSRRIKQFGVAQTLYRVFQE